MDRFFFAVSPPGPLLSRIEALRARFGNPHHKVEPHITIKIPFTWDGEPAAFLEPVRQVLTRTAPFEVRLGSTARFPGPRVLYLTVAGDGLKQLHLAVAEALTGLVPTDARSHEGQHYTPHLTLAAGRFGLDARKMEEMDQAARTALADLPPFTVTALRCYRWRTPPGRWEKFVDLPLQI